MNTFNRILVILIALAIIAISLLLAVQLIFTVNPEQLGLSLWLTELINPLIQSDWQTRLTYLGLCFGAFVLGAVLLYIELRPLLLREPRILLSKDDFGKVEITESCIGKFITYEARHFSDVLDASSQIVNKKDGLHIKSIIFVKPDTKIKEITQNLQESLKNNLENKLGVLISSIFIVAKINSETSVSKRILK